MPWYRVLIEATGQYRAEAGSGDPIGLFTTRNVEAGDEPSARHLAPETLSLELLEIEREGSAHSSIQVIAVRRISGPAAFGAGYTFHDGKGDARESALSVEQAVFESDSRRDGERGILGAITSVWRRLAST